MGNTHTNDMEPSICTEIMKNFASAGAISVEDGALTQLYCATSPEVQNKNIRGKFFIPIAHELDPMPEVESKELQEQLWTYSEEVRKNKLDALGIHLHEGSAWGVVLTRLALNFGK